jgi:hypothetical protein
MVTHPFYIAVTAATVAMPASTDGVYAADRHLIGIALFIAERDPKGRWRFARRAYAIAAGETEGALLDWAAARLPSEAMLIGWNVDHGLVPALLDAAATAPPTIAHRFLCRLLPLLTGGVVDIALAHGGAGAPTLATVAADMAIYAPTWTVDGTTGAWAVGAVDQLRRHLGDEALAIWRTFVRTAGVTGLSAEAATDAWVLRRQRMNALTRTDSAS